MDQEEISEKIRSAIKAKLTELGCYIDDELPDYIMVMIANKKDKTQMSSELELFLTDNAAVFTDWLDNLLERLQSVKASVKPDAQEEPPLQEDLETEVDTRAENRDSKNEQKEDVVNDEPSAGVLTLEPENSQLDEEEFADPEDVKPAIDIIKTEKISPKESKKISRTSITSVDSRQTNSSQSKPGRSQSNGTKIISTRGDSDIPSNRRRLNRDSTRTGESGTSASGRESKNGAREAREPSPWSPDRLSRSPIRERSPRRKLSPHRSDRRALSPRRAPGMRMRDEHERRPVGRGRSRTPDRPRITSRVGQVIQKDEDLGEEWTDSDEDNKNMIASVVQVKSRAYPEKSKQAPKTLLQRAFKDLGRPRTNTTKLIELSDESPPPVARPDPASRLEQRRRAAPARGRSPSPRSRSRSPRHDIKDRRLLESLDESEIAEMLVIIGERRRAKRNQTERPPLSARLGGLISKSQRTRNELESNELESNELESNELESNEQERNEPELNEQERSERQGSIEYNAPPATVSAPGSPKFVVTLDGISDLRQLLPNTVKSQDSLLEDDLDLQSETEEVTPVSTNFPHRSQRKPIQPPHPPSAVAPVPDNTLLCAHYPGCRYGQNCRYRHPTGMTASLPQFVTPVGTQVVTQAYVLPAASLVPPIEPNHGVIPCKFGDSCTRGAACLYYHPNLTQTNISATDQPLSHYMQSRRPSSQNAVCKFFPKCINMNCPFIHPKPCRFGISCSMKGFCKFSHPSLPSLSKLRWSKFDSMEIPVLD